MVPFRVFPIDGKLFYRILGSKVGGVPRCDICNKDITGLDGDIYNVERCDPLIIGQKNYYFQKITCSEECANMCILQNMDRKELPYAFIADNDGNVLP